MNILDWFRAGPEAANKVLDAGVKGIDALVYTDEEKAEAKRQMVAQWIDLQRTMGEETSVRGVTRRFIAFASFIPYVLLILIACVVYKMDPEFSKFLMEVAEGKFGWIVLSVVGFYVGPPMIARAMGK